MVGPVWQCCHFACLGSLPLPTFMPKWCRCGHFTMHFQIYSEFFCFVTAAWPGPRVQSSCFTILFYTPSTAAPHGAILSHWYNPVRTTCELVTSLLLPPLFLSLPPSTPQAHTLCAPAYTMEREREGGRKGDRREVITSN